jgi:hypothetical protein
MRAQWKCDKCPTVGHLSPKVEPITEKYEVTVPGPKGPEKVIKDRPKMTSLRVQDTHTGKMSNQPVVAVKDLGTRITIIQLRVGDESVAIQLCKSCLDSFRGNFASLWSKLEEVVNG